MTGTAHTTVLGRFSAIGGPASPPWRVVIQRSLKTTISYSIITQISVFVKGYLEKSWTKCRERIRQVKSEALEKLLARHAEVPG